MFQGMRTVVYHTPDLEVGKAWYTKVLGFGPYFDQPFYVGYNVGGFELGLIPNRSPGNGGQIAYWGVADINAAVERMKGLGQEPSSPIEDVGSEIKVVEYLDPFGNTLGMIYNPHFKLPEVQ
jgi:predicted enzyme related to lactoylglutathione lyase